MDYLWNGMDWEKRLNYLRGSYPYYLSCIFLFIFDLLTYDIRHYIAQSKELKRVSVLYFDKCQENENLKDEVKYFRARYEDLMPKPPNFDFDSSSEFLEKEETDFLVTNFRLEPIRFSLPLNREFFRSKYAVDHAVHMSEKFARETAEMVKKAAKNYFYGDLISLIDKYGKKR
jgi:hypothetical protein